VTGIVRNNNCCARVEEIGGIKPVSSAEVTWIVRNQECCARAGLNWLKMKPLVLS
jgi:hypothetical protein